ncbi:MAG: hypothetical protein PHG08_01730 [Bacilli bacterium]|jgi:ABC-type xylose transport system permease subunit|nr:hypothetical protein [Bacilli bacterium]HHU24155.1 hypothetical protein [Acholeplasmataceae bacterium]
MLKRKIVAVTPLVATLVFLLLGFIWEAWHPGWIVFLSIPIVGTIEKITRKNMKAKITSLTFLFCLITFFILGFAWGAWHPGWLVFFLIPIVSTLVYS